MQRIILTTCGTSLLTSNCWKGRSNTKSVIILKSPEREEHEKKYRKFIESYKKNPAGMADKFDPDVWNDSSKITWLPAELASLRTIQLFCTNNSPPGSLTNSDRLILLQADNDDARFCADVIHRVLVSHKLLPVQIEPLWCIEKLDPQMPKEFNHALLENLWKKLESRMPFQKEVSIKYYLNVTGGYKAMGMLLACFGYMKGCADTSIFYLNEASGEEVLINSFDPSKTNDLGMRLKLGYIEANTGKLLSYSLNPILPQDL